jgi:hypothetical protein
MPSICAAAADAHFATAISFSIRLLFFSPMAATRLRDATLITPLLSVSLDYFFAATPPLFDIFC